MGVKGFIGRAACRICRALREEEEKPVGREDIARPPVDYGLEAPAPGDIFITPALTGLYDKTVLAAADGSLVRQFRVPRAEIAIPFARDPVLRIFTVPPSHSMRPTFSHFHHVGYLDGDGPDERRTMVEWLADQWLNPPPGEKPKANIVVYNIPGYIYAVHRLYEIGEDEQGRLWRFKGDNPVAAPDPYPARDEHIWWVLALIIY